MLIRPARPDEADALTALAIRSKAYWVYPSAFLVRFTQALGLTPEVVAANEVWVAERSGEVLGFYTLLRRDTLAVLDDLWLEPVEIGRGLGRLLFDHARTRATAAGAGRMEWDAEPHAVGFYQRMGGRHVRWVDSPLGRPLPLMRLDLDPAVSVPSTTIPSPAPRMAPCQRGTTW